MVVFQIFASCRFPVGGDPSDWSSGRAPTGSALYRRGCLHPPAKKFLFEVFLSARCLSCQHKPEGLECEYPPTKLGDNVSKFRLNPGGVQCESLIWNVFCRCL